MIDNAQEKKQAAASYILNFYNQVLMLNDQYSRYLNFLTEIQAKYGAAAEDKTEIEERSLLIDLLRNVRYVVTTSHIQYTVIAKSIGIKREIEEATQKEYLAIRDTFIIKRTDLEKYVFTLNTFLINSIIQELLNSSSEFLDGVFKENGNENK